MLFDLFGALTSLLSTYYFVRLDIKAWPAGLVATCFNGWLYWQKGIYADMCLESFYFVSLCYGWYRWSPTSHQKSVSLKHYSNNQWIHLCVVLIVLYLVVFSLLISFSNSTVPQLDALTTSLSIVAQWLMCHKVITTWLLWFCADAIYALMYLLKNLPFHTLLMLGYTGMAIAGYMRWRKQLKSLSSASTMVTEMH